MISSDRAQHLPRAGIEDRAEPRPGDCLVTHGLEEAQGIDDPVAQTLHLVDAVRRHPVYGDSLVPAVVLSDHRVQIRCPRLRLELWPRVDGAVKSRFLMRAGWVIIVHVYFTRPTDRGIV